MRTRTCTANAAKSAQHRGRRRSTGVRFGSHAEEKAARGSVRATRPKAEKLVGRKTRGCGAPRFLECCTCLLRMRRVGSRERAVVSERRSGYF